MLINRQKQKHGKTGWLILLSLCLAVALFSGWKLIGIFRDYRQSERQFRQIEKEYVKNVEKTEPTKQSDQNKKEKEINFEGLQKRNPDIRAWIAFEHLDQVHISYPVLYSGDDETYLRHDIDGNYHIAGCIFLEGENHPDFSDYHSIIYGHNMRNTTMFGDLKRYKKEQGFYENNPEFLIYTEKKVLRYRIFSYYDVDADSNVYTVGYEPGEAYQKYLDALAASSMKDTGIHPKSTQKIVTLSTCSETGSDQRFVIHGVCVEETDR